MKEDALSKSGGHKHYTEFNHSEISGVSEIYIAISKSPRNLILMGSLILTQVFFNLYSHTDRKDTWWFRHILRFAFQRQPLTHLSKLVTVLNLYIFSSKALQGEMNKPLVATCSMHTSQSLNTLDKSTMLLSFSSSVKWKDSYLCTSQIT